MNIEQLYQHYIEKQLVSTDTRKIENGAIFFALKGENFNGNAYAEKAIQLGAKIAIVDEKDYENQAIGIYCVENVLETLQELAKFHRSKLKIPIIGLTGSNGKTTTKELIAAVLKQKFDTYFTQGNLNNHIGVPLTVLSITQKHQMAVIEMGANHQKEIEQLSAICQPDIGYITNFGKAHLEGFGGVEGVIKGKSELYQFLKVNNKKVIVNLADSIQVEKSKAIEDKITFGDLHAHYFMEKIESKNNFLSVRYKNTQISSNLTGDYNFANVCVAIALGLHFSIPIEKIKLAIESYFPTNMRSQLIEKGDKQILLDAYNANPSSMEVALTNFSTFAGKKAVILGDMFELGESELEEHQKIVDKAIELKIELILLVGERFFKTTTPEIVSVKKFETKEILMDYLTIHKLPQNIMIKGSRGMALEKVVDFIT